MNSQTAHQNARAHFSADPIPCPACGVRFTPSRRWQRYCTARCKNTHHRALVAAGRAAVQSQAGLLDVLLEARALFATKRMVIDPERRAKYTRLADEAQRHIDLIQGKPA
jgi:hypothetical protein